MPDTMNMLFLLLAAGVGMALFFAAREFVRGVRLAKQEHDARGAHGPRPDGQNDPHKEAETPHRPWHEILEVSPTAGTEEIAVAYRRMISLYHPDKVSSLGIELRAVAERRAKEINEAYSIARKMRGL